VQLRKIHVVGLGVMEQAELSSNAVDALDSASIIIGWKRHKAMLAQYEYAHKFIEVKKIDELKGIIDQAFVADNSAVAIAVVASGDPLHFGIGRWFSTQFQNEELIYHPAISSIQAACHKQGLSLQDVEVVSLHGRPLERLRPKLGNNRTLVILTDKFSTPACLARECIAYGFDMSVITVHESLGYTNEVSTRFTAQELSDAPVRFDPLHVTIIELKGRGGRLPEFPGIPDTLYQTGADPGEGMITKREVRLVISSMLAPTAGDVIWDVGAGCGGVAVELSYWNAAVHVYAIECHSDRLAYLAQNRQYFGVTENLHIIPGRAPEALAPLPQANKIFIGGSNGQLHSFLTHLWPLVPQYGVLVASGVTDSSTQILEKFACELRDGVAESVEIGVKRCIYHNEPQCKTKKPVTIFTFTKSLYT